MSVAFVRERVSKVNLGVYLHYAAGWTMRVWREEPTLEVAFYDPGRTQVDNDIANTVSKFVEHVSNPLTVARAVMELPRVRAVELLDLTGFGEKLRKS